MAALSIERILHKMFKQEDVSFIGVTLQCMSIKMTPNIPTAGVCFNRQIKQFELLVNETWFDALPSDDQRIAVMVHELNHIFFKHVFIPQEIVLSKNKTKINISMDLVINQFIKNLPEQCFTIEKIKDKNKKPFPQNLTFVEYYDLLDDATMEVPDCNGNEHSDDQKGPQCDGSCSGKDGDKKKGKTGTKTVKVSDYYDEKPFDTHGWDAGEGQEAKEATQDLIKRSMQKASTLNSRVPGSIKELLEEIDADLRKINYKELLLKALRQSLPSKDIRKTWKRPSRRLGEIAKGNMTALMPKLQAHLDTSGSISIEEANEFLAVTNNFMTVGVSSAHIHLWHTVIYYSQKIKKNFKLARENFQSGGTDLQESINHIHKTKPDLAIIITDGYYSMPNIPKGFSTPLVFVISKQGDISHPLHKRGTTVKY